MKHERLFNLEEAAKSIGKTSTNILEYALQHKITIATVTNNGELLFIANDEVIHKFVSNQNITLKTKDLGLTYLESPTTSKDYMPSPGPVFETSNSDVTINTLKVTVSDLNNLKKSIGFFKVLINKFKARWLRNCIKIILSIILTPALILFCLSLYYEKMNLSVYPLNALENNGILLFAIETQSNLDVEIDNITIEYSSNEIELQSLKQDGLNVTIDMLYTGGTGFIIEEKIKLHKDLVYVYGIPYTLKGNQANLKFQLNGKIIESKWPKYLKLFPPSKQEDEKILLLLLGKASPNLGKRLTRNIEGSIINFKAMQFKGMAINEIIENGVFVGDKILHMDWKTGEPVKMYLE
jgi:hypothetical protein